MGQCLHLQDYVQSITLQHPAQVSDAIKCIIGHFSFTFQRQARHLLGHRLHNAAQILRRLRAFGEQEDFAVPELLRMRVGKVAAPGRSGTMYFTWLDTERAWHQPIAATPTLDAIE